MDRYQVKVDKDSGIRGDLNTWSEAPCYIVGLVVRIAHVSMQTLRIVAEFPGWNLMKGWQPNNGGSDVPGCSRESGNKFVTI